MSKPRPYVVGISSVSGGGKTTIAKELCRDLPNSVGLFFDDFDDTTVHPDDFYQWVVDGGDYNAWQTPGIVKQLEVFKSDREHDYVVFDAPLGRAHEATGRFIDLMVYIDTPLDVAMARRLLRDYQPEGADSPERLISGLRDDLSHYLEKARLPYLEMATGVKPRCDIVLDGTLDPKALVAKIVDALPSDRRTTDESE